MKLLINDYKLGYKIVSIVYTECSKEDLLQNEDLEFIYIKKDVAILYPSLTELSIEDQSNELYSMSDYDVCEIWPNGTIHLLFDNNSIDNYFFVTGKCNSNCIMCPSAEYSRRNGIFPDIDNLIQIAKHIPISAAHLTITGGEPFIAGNDLIKFMSFLQSKFEETEILLLTNGRALAVKNILEQLCCNAPNKLIVGIPIHGSNSILHDSVTQVSGSFDQTCLGIKKLLLNNIAVELRIVVSKINYLDMYDLAKLIVNNYRTVLHVSIMAMEMTGSAFENREKIWIPYSIAAESIEKAIDVLIMAGINVKLYNFPLCVVDKKYRTLCEKSISPEKIRFSEKCDLCNLKKSCGGVFNGTLMLEEKEFIPQI